MKSMKIKFAIVFLLVGLLSACSGGAATNGSSQSSGGSALATAPAAANTSAATAGSASSGSGGAAAAATVSFAKDILPLLQNRCVNCHGGERTSKGLSLNSFDAVMAGSENGPVVTAGDAANSSLVQMVASGKMPKRGPQLTPAEVQLITDWINQGAKNN
jgi:uncharacterized membrane protein